MRALSGVTITGGAADCAGATEIYGLFRSTFGFNEIFNTKAFSLGPLHNVSFEVGAGEIVGLAGLRGQVVLNDGTLEQKPGYGRFLVRTSPMAPLGGAVR